MLQEDLSDFVPAPDAVLDACDVVVDAERIVEACEYVVLRREDLSRRVVDEAGLFGFARQASHDHVAFLDGLERPVLQEFPHAPDIVDGVRDLPFDDMIDDVQAAALPACHDPDGVSFGQAGKHSDHVGIHGLHVCMQLVRRQEMDAGIAVYLFSRGTLVFGKYFPIASSRGCSRM